MTFRDVLGTKYISDFENGFECKLEELMDNTHATCGFCKKPIGDESEVGRVLSIERFVCNDCLIEPKITAVG